jgi:pimeloyl-ACP methyl ester carboxylesterase
VGGSDDGLFSVEEWERGSEKLRAPLHVIPGAGHQVMLEPSWGELAELLDKFAKRLSA